ncbi:MAG: MFS transporter [Thermoanaerobaculia bacterium]
MAVAWFRKLGLERRVGALAVALFVYGFGQELWFRYLPEYLRVLGASAFTVGAFGTMKDLLDAAYAYPGGVASDRLGSRDALLLFGILSAAGFGLYLVWSSVPALFCGLVLVMAWPSLGLPATFALVGEELRGGRRIVGFTVQAVLKRIPIVLAPPLGGLLIQRLGMRTGLRAGFAVSVVLATAMLVALRRAFRDENRAADLHEKAPKPSVRLHRSLRRLLIADCLVRLCEGLPDVFLVIWALEIVRISPLQFGLLTSVLMGTAILSYVPAAALAERAEKKRFVVLTYLFFTLFPLAVVLSRSFGSLALAYVIGGLREIGEPARKTLIVDLAEPPLRGRTVGLYYSIRGFAVAGAAAIGGALWTVRPALTFAVAAGLGALGTLFAAAFLPPTSRGPAGVD